MLKKLDDVRSILNTPIATNAYNFPFASTQIRPGQSATGTPTTPGVGTSLIQSQLVA